MLIVESKSLDVYRNLALEEYLMDWVQDRGPILFLWQSDCAVVMGKNQNPWKECRLDVMKRDGVPLARRISGGGAVYHDAGNLNYCVITGREEYCEGDAYNLVFRALEAFGIHAEKTGKSNLSVDGLKFSGNAFAFRKGRVMHHGTLLLQTDLARLGRYLGSMLEGIDTHAIASVPARVMNLGLDVRAVATELKRCFAELYENGPVGLVDAYELAEPVLAPLVARQRSADWQFNSTPKFAVEMDGCRLEVVGGRIERAEGPDAAAYLGRLFAGIV
jgi:lipoate-protein ligase A